MLAFFAGVVVGAIAAVAIIAVLTYQAVTRGPTTWG